MCLLEDLDFVGHLLEMVAVCVLYQSYQDITEKAQYLKDKTDNLGLKIISKTKYLRMNNRSEETLFIGEKD